MPQEYSTQPETWSIGKLVKTMRPDGFDNKIVTVPTFQRRLVWNTPQKHLLIDSIKKGLPIGAILLHQQYVENGKQKYLIIDGLQRASTLREYTEQPASFFDKEREDDDVNNLLSKLSNFYHLDKKEYEQLKTLVIEWLNSTKSFATGQGYSSNTLTGLIDNKLNKNSLQSPTYRTFVDELDQCLEAIKTASDISAIEIPMIIFTGDTSLLPTIFERLNSGGTKLSKFEVFAAGWAQRIVEIQNKDIKKMIINRYSTMQQNGLQIDCFDLNNPPSEFNFFEYLFGFSKHILSKHTHLFSSKKEDEIDSIGFYIATICAGLDLPKMYELPEEMKNVNLQDFESRVLNAVRETENSLKGFLDIKVNKTARSSKLFECKILDYQIVSIIGYFYHILYDEMNQRNERRLRLEALKRNVPYHYLFDALRKNWSNAGDTKATRVYNEKTYENTLSKEEWDSVLTAYFSDTKKKLAKDRVQPDSDTILLFKYMYGSILNARDQQANVQFQIEHLVPVGRLKEAIPEESPGLPINCLSNLCLLPQELNQSKGDLTVYEWYDKVGKPGCANETEAKALLKKIEQMTFTKRTDLEFVKYFDDPSRHDEAIRKYDEFLNKRFVTIKKKFFEQHHIK